ncbi:MAG TPA: hypothetical protein H9836_19070 [Candidatus Nocardiopsis merdipullorum]|nr:hypothetical protein [Candidatus Nocardiopsis merdipullorum]
MTIDFSTDGAGHDIAQPSDAVRDHLIMGFVHLASIVTKYPDALHLEHVDNLTRNERTDKTPAIVRR